MANRWGNNGNSDRLYFGGLQNHCRWLHLQNHCRWLQPWNEKEACSLKEKKVMTNLDSISQSRDITLLTKVNIVKAKVFPVVMYGYDCWTIKKAEHQRIAAFELWCWRRFLRVPWTARRSNQSVLKEINPEYSWEGLMLKLKLQYFDHLNQRFWCWERLKAGGEGDDRGQDGWMASVTRWTWVWASSGSWWRTGKPGVLQSLGFQSQTWRSDWTAICRAKGS